jgi:hypothetical protein
MKVRLGRPVGASRLDGTPLRGDLRNGLHPIHPVLVGVGAVIGIE